MKLTADEQILREVLLDLLDSGPTSRPQWDFYEDHGPEGAQTEDGANRDRLEFVDEVINRIRRAKAPEAMYVQCVGRANRKDVPGVKVSAMGVDQRPRGHYLSVEEERELRDNPPPMVIDDIDEAKKWGDADENADLFTHEGREIPLELDPRPLLAKAAKELEIVKTLLSQFGEQRTVTQHERLAFKIVGHTVEINNYLAQHIAAIRTAHSENTPKM